MKSNGINVVRVFVCALLCVPLLNVSALAEGQIQIRPDKAWFIPQLVVNNDAVCDDLFADAKEKFFSKESYPAFYDLYKLRNRGVRNIKNLKLLGGHEVSELNAYQKTFYIHPFRHPGCGGACEAYQALVSESPFAPNADYSALSRQAELAPPAESYDYLIAQDESQIPYLLIPGTYGPAKETLKVYKLSSQGNWDAACVISFKPDLEKANYKGLKDAKVAVRKLEQTANNMRMGAGNCGSMHTHLRWAALLNDKLSQTLYRPWAVKYSDTSYRNAHAIYDQVYENLKVWSLTGVQQSHLFAAYNKQLSESTLELARFFQYSYQWPESYALEMAVEALTGGVAYGFGFYMYNTGFYEREGALRTAILNKAPMEEIKKYASDLDVKSKECCADYGSEESLLNIAINYPEALEYLLQLGLDSNQQNEFGKTPLMYAVQNNQLESVSILLNNKADPNLSTIIPQDTCYYTLRNSGMRALHYAVRYASPEVVKLLLKNGADPIVTTSERQGGYPVDWLQRYTAPGAEEINPNIPPGEITSLEKILALPTAEDQEKLVLAFNVSAEKAYSEKQLQEAYDFAQKALQMQPGNERALSNLGLIAIKLGKNEIALEAINKLIHYGTDKKMIANAWYNYGMICDSTRRVYYNGNTYCISSRIHNYLSSYLATPSEARKNKVFEVIESSPGTCRFKGGKVHLMTECGSSRAVGQVCVMHPPGESIDLSGLQGTRKEVIKANGKFSIHEETPVYLGKANKSHQIGDQNFEIYQLREQFGLPIKWDKEICDEDFSVRSH